MAERFSQRKSATRRSPMSKVLPVAQSNTTTEAEEAPKYKLKSRPHLAPLPRDLENKITTTPNVQLHRNGTHGFICRDNVHDESHAAISVASIIQNILPSHAKIFIRHRRTDEEIQAFLTKFRFLNQLKHMLILFLVAGWIINALEFELLTEKHFDCGASCTTLKTIVGLTSLLAVAFRIRHHQITVELVKMEAPLALKIVVAGMRRQCFIASGLILLHPWPNIDSDSTWICAVHLHEGICSVHADQILFLISTITRALYIAAVVFESNIDYSRRMRVFANFAKVHVTPGFQIRRLLHESPLRVIVPIFLWYFFTISYVHMIWERRVLNPPVCRGIGGVLCTFPRFLWLHLVTAFTVGYGKFVPETHTGRVLAFISMAFGLLLGSVIISVATQSLQLTRTEVMLVHTLKEYHLSDSVTTCAAKVIQKCYRSYRENKHYESSSGSSQRTCSSQRMRILSGRAATVDLEDSVRRRIVEWNAKEHDYRAVRQDNTMSMQPMVERIDRKIENLERQMEDLMSAMRTLQTTLAITQKAPREHNNTL